jgi:hypothetical protein
MADGWAALPSILILSENLRYPLSDAFSPRYQDPILSVLKLYKIRIDYHKVTMAFPGLCKACQYPYYMMTVGTRAMISPIILKKDYLNPTLTSQVSHSCWLSLRQLTLHNSGWGSSHREDPSNLSISEVFP